jgi:mRNA interferase MazF
MERGELWWAQFDDKRPVVLLSGGAGPAYRAVQIVAQATMAICSVGTDGIVTGGS